MGVATVHKQDGGNRMTKHEYECELLIQAELADIIEEHGLFASQHEGYSVIREEIREAKCEYKSAKKNLKDLEDAIWMGSDIMSVDAADRIDKAATKLLKEAMQVAATARKYVKTFGKGGNVGG